MKSYEHTEGFYDLTDTYMLLPQISKNNPVFSK